MRLGAGLCVALFLAGVVGVVPAGAGPPPASERCDFTDIGVPENPCVAVGMFSSPGGMVGDFTTDVPGGASFQLVGEEAPGALPTSPDSVIKFPDVTAGTYTITQAVIPGVNLRPLACDGRFESDAVEFGADSFTVTVAEGDFITCDFVNVRHELRVANDADPADGTDFGFTGDLGDFQLDDADPDDGDAVGSDIVLPAPLDTPATVSELVPDGWELTGITCDEGPIRDPDGGDSTDVTIDVAGRSVTATFGDVFARQVHCTFSVRAAPDGPAPAPTPMPTPAALPAATPAEPTSAAPTFVG